MLKNMLSKPQPKKKATKAKSKKTQAKRTGSAPYRISRKVLLFTTGGQVNQGSFSFRGDKIPLISKFLQLFQEYRTVGNITLHYVPGCSTNNNGAIMIGYSAAALSRVERSTVANLSPVVDTPVWQKASLTIPPILATEGNSSFAVATKDKFYVNWASNATDTGNAQSPNYPSGEVWATMTLEFISPVI